MKTSKLFLIGFLQALAVISYCGFIGSLLYWFGEVFADEPEFLGIALMLSLLVFSAAITGSLVFGYPAYLALNQKLREAVLILAFTAISLPFLIFVLVVILFLAK